MKLRIGQHVHLLVFSLKVLKVDNALETTVCLAKKYVNIVYLPYANKIIIYYIYMLSLAN